MATEAPAAATVFDGGGRPVSLGPELAKGGEGSILPVTDRPELVAKLYHEPVAPEKVAKLAAMARLATPRLLRLAAWPVGTLHDRPGGAVRGVLMPRVREGRELHLLYGPKTRRREFPDATLPFLVHAAANVARAFAVVHEHGHVIGDVNHGSVLVSKRATVTLVDCDSFQVRDGGHDYLCAVGVPTHTPPELQGRPFAGLARTPNHDAFGLAVLIFQLLFLGRHPFSGGFLGAGELALERAIGEFRFAYGTGAAVRQMRQPPGTPPLEAASPPVAALFERAFAPAGARPAGRPSAREWAGALEGLAGQLTTCARHGGHHYPRTLGACPWCAVEATTKLVLFNGAVTAPGAARPGVAFDLATIWAAIAAVPDPGPPPPLVAAPAVAPSPAAVARGTTLRRARRAERVKKGAAIVAIAGSSLALLAANAPIIAVFGWLVALAAAVAFMVARAVVRPAARARAEAERTLRGARAHLDEVERRWREGAGNAAFLAQRRELESNRDAYRDLPALRQRRLQTLTANPRQHQLQRHLDRHRVAAASIKGVGPGRKATLQSYGIETAADVVEGAVLRVPGFGPALTASLLAWRREIEGRFVFDPRRGVTTADSAEIEREIAATRARLEGALRRGPAQLRETARQADAVRAALRPALEQARAAVARAEADLHAL
jgi:DNA-binding helix-hairpin-helix protein with protein kinase domain